MEIKGGNKVLNAILEYQVPGSVNTFDEKEFTQDGIGFEWSDHCPGTMIYPNVGQIYPGMPKAFSRLGSMASKPFETKINIFETFNHMEEKWGYDKFNVPVWKYLNENGHTFVRGLCPRINKPFIHIILEDCIAEIDCIEITEEDMAEMD